MFHLKTGHYKIMVIAMCIMIVYTSTIAVEYSMLLFNRPPLPDSKIKAYNNLICDLQRQLDYPVCQVDGSIYHFDELP